MLFFADRRHIWLVVTVLLTGLIPSPCVLWAFDVAAPLWRANG